MSENIISEVGKMIVDVLIANERLQFALKCNKADIPDAIYLLYSSTVKLITKVISVELRPNRIFRLKYHHILSNESVEEYLYHCLSKILSEVLDEENSYQRFVQPVAELHMKLMSIINQIQQQHCDIVCKNNKVRKEIDKNKHVTKIVSKSDSNAEHHRGLSLVAHNIIGVAQSQLNSWSTHEPSPSLLYQESYINEEARFLPVYYVPSLQSSAKLKKSQFLTLQAINKHYTINAVDQTMFDMLLDFDNSFADFELDFVCQVNKTAIISKECAEKTMDVAVMFADAVLWAHKKGLLQYSSIADCDIEMMVGIPRLAVLYGCGVAKHGPLSEWTLLSCRNKDKAKQQLAPVFQNHFRALARLRRQLNVLNRLEMAFLSRLLLDHSDLADIGTSQNPLSHLKFDGSSHLVSGDVHALFKLISSVSDQMQSEHASDYRFFMETVFKLYKDIDDDDNHVLGCSSMLPFGKSHSISDLYLDPGYLSSIIDVDEAVEALSYGEVTDTQALDSDSQSKSMWDLKVCASPHFAHGKRMPLTDTSTGTPTPTVDLHVQFHRPEWQHDSSCSKCCHCGINFNLFRRRHHCRRCGYLFCNSCWGTKVPLPSLGIHNEVPVCVECQEFIEGATTGGLLVPPSQGAS